MKSGLCAFVFFWMVSVSVQADPLINSELPSARVRDTGEFMTPPARAILADYLDTLSQTQKTEFYVVILKDVGIEEAVRFCNQWQALWVPKGQGGVFVYSVPDKKYSFTPSPETLKTVGEEKIQLLFRSAVENPPLRQSLDVVIATPVLRIVTSIGQTHIEENASRAETGEAQTSRWQVIAAMAGAFAIVGWILCFSKMMKGRTFGTQAGVPPPGATYRNPPKRSRSGRRSSRSLRDEGGSEDESGGGERRSRRDRF